MTDFIENSELMNIIMLNSSMLENIIVFQENLFTDLTEITRALL